MTETRLVGCMTYPQEQYDLLTVMMLCHFIEDGKREVALEMMKDNEPLPKFVKYTQLAETVLRQMAKLNGIVL